MAPILSNSWKTGYYVWSYPPSSFSPSVVEFDVQVAPGNFVDDGWVGVICRYYDESNFHLVEFDLSNFTYGVRQYLNDELYTLSASEWVGLVGTTGASADFHQVLVDCSIPDEIAIFFDGAYQAVITGSMPVGGDLALMVHTTDVFSGGSFKAYFDNFSAWVPVQ